MPEVERIPAWKVTAGDVLLHRAVGEEKRGGTVGRAFAVLDGEALVVLVVRWPEDVDGRGEVRTRILGGGAGPTLRPRRGDQVEVVQGL